MLFCGFLAIVVSSTACRITARSTLEQPGYLVPGLHAARILEISPTDTISEVSAARVPTAVITTAARLASQHGKQADCSRFFTTSRIIVVVLGSFCGDRFGKETDARFMVGILPSGTVKDTLSWMTQRYGATIVPHNRINGNVVPN